MVMFILQALVFISVAFILGCLFGCWLKRRQNGELAHDMRENSAATPPETVVRAVASAPSPASVEQDPAAGPAQSAASLISQSDLDNATISERVVNAAVQPTADKTAVQTPAKPKATKGPEVTSTDDAAAKPAAAKAGASRKSAAKAAVKTPAKAKGGTAGAVKAKSAASSSAAADEAKPATRAAAKPKSPAKSVTVAKPKAAARAKTATQPKTAKAAIVAKQPDDLKQIKGIGPQIEGKLNAAGITSFAQIAAWSAQEQKEFGERLVFKGRIEREDWVSQAKILAEGGTTEFSNRVAKGKVESSKNIDPEK